LLPLVSKLNRCHVLPVAVAVPVVLFNSCFLYLELS
jgi:hypothetical protein